MNLKRKNKSIKIKLSVLLCTLIICSCGNLKREYNTYELLKQSQQIYNSSIKQERILLVLTYDRLDKLHRERIKNIIDKGIIEVSDGFVYIIDKFGGGYSNSGVSGNIWSNENNIYYYFSEFDSQFKVLNNDEIKEIHGWDLFRRAVEEWDLTQIENYYKQVTVSGNGIYIASRMKLKNKQIIDIENFIWYDNNY